MFEFQTLTTMMKPRASLASALLTALASVLAFTGGVDAASSSPLSIPVATSRGEYKLLVFKPDSAPAAPEAGTGADARPIILLVSGEGGWRRFDSTVSGYLRDAGYWVGGVDAMRYFWSPQDDRSALSNDMKAHVDALAQAAGARPGTRVILAGFSFGADLAPWVAGAGGWEGRVQGLALIGPDETGSLEFRLLEMFGFDPKDHIFSVAGALKDAAGYPVFFLHGEKDSGSAAPSLMESASEPKKLTVVPGANHHFTGHDDEMRTALLEGIDWLSRQGPSGPGAR